MKKLLALITLLLCFRSFAGDITPGITLQDGQRLTAAELAQLVNQAKINTSFYTAQVAANTNLQPGDILLVVSASGTFHKILGSGILNNQQIFTGQPVFTNIPPYATLLYYDPTNNFLAQIVVTNFTYSQASNLPVNLLVFAKTNAGSTNILNQILPPYTNTPNYFSTNNQTELLIWDTNGVPYEITFSNFVNAFVPPLGSNLFTGWEYTNNFSPWLFPNTNATTNAYGFYTNFLISSLFFTNTAQTNPAFQTLTNSDRIPILTASQQSNTTATLGAIYQFITNQFTQPPFTVARAQFNGTPLSFNVTNATIASNWFFATNSGLIGPQAISWQFSGSSGTTLPTSPQIVSNQVYYAMPANGSNFICYTNYGDALAGNHPIAITGTVSVTAGQNIVLYLTNYTAFNLDAIQLCSGSSINTANYGMFFRVNAVNALYYVVGNAQPQVANPSFGITVNNAADGVYTTNRFNIFTAVDAVGYYAAARTQVLVYPQ